MTNHNYRKYADEQIDKLVGELKQWQDQVSTGEADQDVAIPFFILAQHATQALIQIAHAAPAIADLLAGEDGAGLPGIESSIDTVNVTLDEISTKLDSVLSTEEEEEENEEQ